MIPPKSKTTARPLPKDCEVEKNHNNKAIINMAIPVAIPLMRRAGFRHGRKDLFVQQRL